MAQKKKPKKIKAHSPSRRFPTQVNLWGRSIQTQTLILVVILLLASLLRVIHLGQSPPGLNVDEAVNAWNAYSVFKTGMDQHGVHWPIFDTACFGQGMTTLYLYLLIPFQAVFGLTILSIRLPAALAGVLTVYLLYWVGRRLFNPWTGLLAAAFLAVNPWHLQQGRWGHPASILPLLVMAPLAAMVWARLPFDDEEDRPPRVIPAALAGAITGICCYGYQAARLWLPIFFTATVVVNWRAWWKALRTRRGALAIGALIFSVGMTFGPLLWETMMNPLLMKRAEVTWVWSPSDSLTTRVEKVLARYPGHFGLDFLFVHGDPDYAYSPPEDYGLFHWYMLPLMLLGLTAVLPKLKSSRSARLLMTWVLLYPAADLLNEHPTMHALRSLPGVCALVLLAAVGTTYAAKWLWERQRQITVVLAVAATTVILLVNIRFLNYFYGGFNDEPTKYMVGHSDLLEACAWLKPRWNQVDAVFVTSSYMSHPYVYTLVGLQYDPKQWFRDPKEMRQGPLPGGAYNHEQICLRYGKMHFVFGNSSQAALTQLVNNGRSDRVIFIVRPGESSLEREIQPADRILDPQGRPSLLIFDTTL